MATHEIDISGEKPPKNYGLKATIAQTAATIAQSFLLIGLGMELSMPTIAIKDLYNNPGSEFQLTLTEVSWYGSILFIFHPTGSFMSGFLQERFGRKRCMIFANIPSIVGWLLLYYTHSPTLLYASTIMMGLSIGFSEAPILSYVGEITEPRLRGSLASLACTSVIIGSLMLFVAGYFYKWRTVALLSVSCPVTCICLVMMIPESPVWLVSKGENEKAINALCWLRGWVKPETVKNEHLELVHYNAVSGTRKDSVDKNENNVFSKLAHFKDPSVYRPTMLIMSFFFISYITCIAPCRPFLSKIMTNIGIPFDSHDLLLVCFSVLQTTGCVIVILTVHYLGKRFLILSSVSVNSISLLLFGIYVIVKEDHYFISTPLIPIALLCIISFFGGFISTLPWMLLSEIFPNKSRGVATGSCAAMSYLLIFILTKSYLSVEMFLSLEYTMIVFSCTGFLGLIYFYIYLPETENKTLLEIEEFFVEK